MKAVMADVPASVLEERRRTGADRWDEVWDGVLHMPPLPNFDHQDLESAAERWLHEHWGVRTGGRSLHQINVARPGLADWTDDHRIPDLVLATLDRLRAINRNECFEGGPEVGDRGGAAGVMSDERPEGGASLPPPAILDESLFP